MVISFNWDAQGRRTADSLSAVFRTPSPFKLGFDDALLGGARTRERFVEQFGLLSEARKLRETGFLGDVAYVHEFKKTKAMWDARFGKDNDVLAIEKFASEHLSDCSPTIAETFPGLRTRSRGEIVAPQDVIIWPSFFGRGLVMNDYDALATIELHEFQHVKDLLTVERRMYAAGDNQRIMRAVAEIRAIHASLIGAVAGELPVSTEFLFEQSRSYFQYLDDFRKLEKSNTAKYAVTSLAGMQARRDWVLDREPRGIRYTLVFDFGGRKMKLELVAPVENEPGWSEVLRG